MNKEQVQKQAKKIMDDFIQALDKVNLDENFGIEREEETRIPAEPESSEEFKKLMFKNAPKTKDDYIQAEKKKW